MTRPVGTSPKLATLSPTQVAAPRAEPTSRGVPGPLIEAPNRSRSVGRDLGLVPNPQLQLVAARSSAPKKVTSGPVALESHNALICEVRPDGSLTELFSKEAEKKTPIASITKLLTALVILDAKQDPNEQITVTAEDQQPSRDHGSRPRLRTLTQYHRSDLLTLLLVRSDNVAAHMLARSYPGGMDAFLKAADHKAKSLGMSDTKIFEPSGLDPDNVSSARDLMKLVLAAGNYPEVVRNSSFLGVVEHVSGRKQKTIGRNTNAIVANQSWSNTPILVSKTGYISAAGACLVMLAEINGRKIAMVFLKGPQMASRVNDPNKVRAWIQKLAGQQSI